MDILAQTISLLFRHRQAGVEQFGQDIDHTWCKQLHALLSTVRRTEWGFRHDYKNTRSYSDFCQRLPLQTYDEIKPHVTRMISGKRNILWPSVARRYAKGSGTTSDKSKFLPVTLKILKGCHYEDDFDCVVIYLRNNPGSRPLSKKGLTLGDSHSLSSLDSEAHQGDLSTVLFQDLNPLINLVCIPEEPTILMGEWESKIKAIVENTWNKDVNNLSGAPSWMLALIKAILKKTSREYPTDIRPDLGAFFHEEVSFEPYREQHRTLIPSNKMRYMETYNASEGFSGLQDDPADPSLLMISDYSIFYEFIPMNEVDNAHPAVLPLEPVEAGKNYTMVIATLGGLWRYQIGGTIRFTSLFLHKFVISGHTEYLINAFGKELMVDNANKAIVMICLRTGAKVKEYTTAPLFMLDKAKGRYQWFIEFSKKPESLDEFATLLDQNLQKLSSDYEAKRYREISLQPLEVVVTRDGAFCEWLRQKGELDGQHRIPRLGDDRTYMEEFLHINQSLQADMRLIHRTY